MPTFKHKHSNVLSNFFLFVNYATYITVSFASSSIKVSQTHPSISAFGTPPPERLRQLLQSEMDGTRKDPKPILLPCCYDGLTARLIAKAGFEATFMTGFGVSGKKSAEDCMF